MDEQPICRDALNPGLGKWRHRRWHLRWPRSQRMRGLMLLLAGTALIAVMDAVVKLMSTSLGTLQIAWGRFVVQAILLFLVISPRQSVHRLRTRKLSMHLFRVFLLLLSTVFFFGALRTMSLAEANTIAFTSPLMITVLSGAILGEVVGVRRWIAVATGFAGVLLVVQPGSGIMGWAALLPLIAAVSSAVYHITTRLLARSEDPANTLYFVALVGAIGLSVLVPFFWTPLTAPLLLGLIAVGTLGTVGHFFVIRAFQTVPAATLSPFLYVFCCGNRAGMADFRRCPGTGNVAGRGHHPGQRTLRLPAAWTRARRASALNTASTYRRSTAWNRASWKSPPTM
jgi:drug/metabolite transporter (DMT)-like permease